MKLVQVGFGTNGGTFAAGIKENNWLGNGQSVAFNIDVDEVFVRSFEVY